MFRISGVLEGVPSGSNSRATSGATSGGGYLPVQILVSLPVPLLVGGTSWFKLGCHFQCHFQWGGPKKLFFQIFLPIFFLGGGWRGLDLETPIKCSQHQNSINKTIYESPMRNSN